MRASSPSTAEDPEATARSDKTSDRLCGFSDLKRPGRDDSRRTDLNDREIRWVGDGVRSSEPRNDARRCLLRTFSGVDGLHDACPRSYEHRHSTRCRFRSAGLDHERNAGRHGSRGAWQRAIGDDYGRRVIFVAGAFLLALASLPGAFVPASSVAGNGRAAHLEAAVALPGIGSRASSLLEGDGITFAAGPPAAHRDARRERTGPQHARGRPLVRQHAGRTCLSRRADDGGSWRRRSCSRQIRCRASCSISRRVMQMLTTRNTSRPTARIRRTACQCGKFAASPSIWRSPTFASADSLGISETPGAGPSIDT